ncbi:hypothetical protein UFOVP1608_11 [uncultured Caudovirales phage]|uniref:Holin n=1 Tax=uncultured Caudovirales phage TaxID=2100421 RepID=A0A6J5SS57_9CAUD|nr:hypothetical protein UFOVP1608_11 [uncultured Caudovirales phage]
MLDKLPAPVRHCLIACAGILLTYATTAVTTLPAPLPEVAGAVLTMVSLYFTGITKQYGVASTKKVKA